MENTKSSQEQFIVGYKSPLSFIGRERLLIGNNTDDIDFSSSIGYIII